MASIVAEGDHLLLRLGILEKVLSFSGNRRIPLRFVAAIDEVQHPFDIVRDTPAISPTSRLLSRLPGLLYGTMERAAGWEIYAIHGHQPGIRILFSADAPWSRLIVTVGSPAETKELIRRAVEEARS